MINYTINDCAIVDCGPLHFGFFSVLIVPEGTGNEYTFYLRHKNYGVIKYMFTCSAADLTEAANIAYHNAAQYIPDFIQECFHETE